MANERGLERMQRLRRAKPLDRHDIVILMHHGEREAGIDATAVHQHGARAALTVVAPLLAAGQPEMLAGEIQQRGPDVDLRLVGLSIDGEAHVPAFRSVRTILIAAVWSGLAAGIAIHSSLIAEGALHAGLPDAPWRNLVAALGYPVGFLVVILGRMQFFTESTVTAMLPLMARPSLRALRRTVRLWALVLIANLAGTATATLALSQAGLVDAGLRDAMVAVSTRVLAHDGWATFLTAIPAGFLIASVAWVLPNAREQAFFVIYAITFT
ncbi:hypothetical protein LTR94_028990, partial [Friedmanniomyces endolithicus]